MKQTLIKQTVGTLIVLGAVLAGFSIVAHAQNEVAASGTAVGAADMNRDGIVASENAKVKIAFPVPELGNCASKDACHAYCDDVDHMEACIAFAKAHGLMTKDDASRAEDFRKTLAAGAGPGGCKAPGECRSFCSSPTNLKVCVAFAKNHGLKDENVTKAEKILAVIQSGVGLPGNCTSVESCKAYCTDQAHQTECINFAVRAGFMMQPHDTMMSSSSAPKHPPGEINASGSASGTVFTPDPSPLPALSGVVADCVKLVLGSANPAMLQTNAITADQKAQISKCILDRNTSSSIQIIPPPPEPKIPLQGSTTQNSYPPPPIAVP